MKTIHFMNLSLKKFYLKEKLNNSNLKKIKKTYFIKK